MQVQAFAMLGDFHELSYIGGLLLVNIIFSLNFHKGLFPATDNDPFELSVVFRWR